VRAALAAAVVSAAVAAGTVAEAQTTDIFFRSWRWLKEPAAGRAAGLAGATTALADDASSLEANPAGLSTLTRAEVIGTVVGRSSGRTRVGDSLGATTGMGFVALAGRITSRWTAGAYVVEPVVTRIDLAPLPLPDGTRDQGSLDGTVRDLGLATAFEVAEHVHVGARLSAVRLSLAGDYRRQPEAGPPRLEVATRGRETRVATSFGLLYEPTPAVRIGLVTLGGATWRLERTATSPSLETTLDPGSAYDVRQPGGRTADDLDGVTSALELTCQRQVVDVPSGRLVDVRRDDQAQPHPSLV